MLIVVMLNGRTTDNFPTCDEGSKRRRPTSDQKQEVDNINKNHTLCDLTYDHATTTITSPFNDAPSTPQIYRQINHQHLTMRALP